MTREEIAAIIETIPQGMDANDFIVTLVNKAIKIEVEPLKARVQLLERENAWLESHHTW
jgi:hypothetical protein